MKKRTRLPAGLVLGLAMMLLATLGVSSRLAPAQAWSMQYQTVALPDTGESEAASRLSPSPLTTTSLPVWWDAPPQSGSVVMLPSDEQGIEPGVEDQVRVIILLEAESVSRHKSGLRVAGSLPGASQQDQVRAYAREVRESQQQLLQQIEAQDIMFELRREFSYLLNGLAGSIEMKDMKRIKALHGVRSVHLDHEVCVSLDDSVPLIGADQVWTMLDHSAQVVTGHGMRVAVIDTGIDYTHPDLGGCFGPSCRVVGGYDFANDDADPMDDHGHGTHCAGIVAANGTVKGVAPDASLYAFKALSGEG